MDYGDLRNGPLDGCGPNRIVGGRNQRGHRVYLSLFTAPRLLPLLSTLAHDLTAEVAVWLNH